MTVAFKAADGLSKSELEGGQDFAPRFSSEGLITAVVSDVHDGTLLMVAHMNAQALSLTLETGIAHYWSRSRKSLWKKGETSGNMQRVVEARTDCDQDVILLRVTVDGHGASCHTGQNSCFYRKIELNETGEATLTDVGEAPRFDPKTVYSPDQ